jgi:cyanophycinase
MNMKKTIVKTAFALLFFITTNVIAQNPTYIGPEKGTLIIVGGGNVGPEIWAKFVEKAGGANAKIIYVPTAGDDSTILKSNFNTVKKLKELGVNNITVLHTRDPKVANTEKFVAPIRQATGVWFEGGRQWKIADAFLGTLAQKEFNALLNRGGVIGGTSAGATIQGSYLFRGDTKGNTILVGDHVQGLDFIHNVAIDQHILKRNRQFDLPSFIKKHPDLLGIGIDESTAIVVHQNQFEVLGASYVAISDSKQFAADAKNPSGESGNNGPFYYLKKGEKFDLLVRKLIDPTRITKSSSN